jgi:preprotein translocase subunit Sec61beta
MPSICAKSDPDATVYSSVTLARLVLVIEVFLGGRSVHG